MPFNHLTIGTDSSGVLRNFSLPLESITLRTVGAALSRAPASYNAVAVRVGLTPPGDEAVEIYQLLLSARLSNADGVLWTGFCKITAPVFLVINVKSYSNSFLFITWTTA